jgi:hypothetical protein
MNIASILLVCLTCYSSTNNTMVVIEFLLLLFGSLR